MHVTRLRIITIFVVLAAVLAATGCTTRVVTAPSAAPVDSVSASGQGSVFAAPDIATMTFGIEVTTPNAKDALSRASKGAERIIAAVRKAGVEKKDIQTSGVALYPVQDQRSGRMVVTGYQASISVNAKIRDIAAVGDVIEAANRAGANSVNGPSFEISQDSEQRAEAIRKAVENARKNAEAMAQAAGRTIGDVISIASSNVSVPGPLMRSEAYAGTDIATKVPIEAGQLEVTGDVTVTFELK